MRCLAAVVILMMAPGCALEREALLPLEAMDSGAPDSRVADAAFDGGRGTAVLDTGSRDSGPAADVGADSTVPDSGAGDSTPSVDAATDTAPPPTCDDRFGTAEGYIYCRETPGECEFFSDLGGVRTCTETCAAFGSTCLAQWRDGDGRCMRDTEAARTCDDEGRNDDICVCSR